MPNSRDDVQRRRLAQAIITSCVIKHGGTAALARHLGVEQDKVIDWLGGKEVPSIEIVQKAIEPFLGPKS